MVTTQLHLGDNCTECGSSVQVHLQNPFGIKVAVESFSAPKNDWVTDYFFCREFVDEDGEVISRDELFRRASSM